MPSKKIFVLRIGHRPKRDVRITTHVALVARAFGATGFILEGNSSNLISVKSIMERWGGNNHFELGSTSKPKEFVEEWKNSGGLAIHLTMYGLNISNHKDILKTLQKPILIIVGAGKVEHWYYDNSDYNMAIGNQPHSEVAALAIFLDRVYKGKELSKEFEDAELKILEQEHGKKVIKR